MHLLWIAVLIQTLFFIVSDAHFYVLTFIGLSLILQAFSKNPLVFLLGPMIIVHLLFVYWPIQEGLKIKKNFNKKKKSAIKTTKKTANKASKGISKGVSAVKQQATNTYNSTKKMGDGAIKESQSSFKKLEESAKKGASKVSKVPKNEDLGDGAKAVNDAMNLPKEIDVSGAPPPLAIKENTPA